MMSVEFIDNSPEVLSALQQQTLRALENCGLVAERYAKEIAPSPGKYGTGALRNSITHRVDPDEQAAYVGVPTGPTSYGIYLEFGTGKYYPGGRDTPWAYQDAKGNWHRTEGQKAQPFIKPAVADHQQQYIDIIEGELKGE